MFYLMYRIIQIYLRHSEIDLLDILRNNSFIKILTTRIVPNIHLKHIHYLLSYQLHTIT